MPPGEGILTDLVEETLLSGAPDAHGDRPVRYRAIVNCGRPVRDMKVEIRDDDGAVLGDRQIGRIYCSGPSVMFGYFRDPEAHEAYLHDRDSVVQGRGVSDRDDLGSIPFIKTTQSIINLDSIIHY